MAHEPSFRVTAPAVSELGETLLVGLSHMGMAGLTAVDYLVRQAESTEVGHVSPAGVPGIAPFQAGEARHHTRLYTLAEDRLSVVVGELLIPPWMATTFTDAILEWVDDSPIEEITILHGVPFPHGPEEHTVFYVSTPAYRERRLSETAIQPLAGGVLDGVSGELVSRSLDEHSPPVGVLVTPAHPPGPDVDASIRLLEAVQETYGLAVDATELEQRAEELKQYYAELADRMNTLAEQEQPLGSRDFPEDRMYM